MRWSRRDADPGEAPEEPGHASEVAAEPGEDVHVGEEAGEAVASAVTSQATEPGEASGGAGPLQIGIALFDGVEELDWAGPWEVLASWARFFPDDGVRVCTLAPSGDPVTCAKGARVLGDHTWDDHPILDVLVYPGGEGTRRQLDDRKVLRWVQARAHEARLVASVCTGALVLASAGLLDGRPATTHWSTLDQLGGLGTDIEVRADERVVDDGDIVTAAGVSAGIDMALHLVARFAGRDRAKQVQKIIEYYPEPPA